MLYQDIGITLQNIMCKRLKMEPCLTSPRVKAIIQTARSAL